MAKERLSMRKLKEVLRLKFETDLSNRQIAKSCSTSHVTVGKYLALAEQAALSWPLPENLDGYKYSYFCELYFSEAGVFRSWGRTK